jgi:hypothetical protein
MPLEKLRVEIDALDKKIQSLIGSRAELASALLCLLVKARVRRIKLPNF